MSKTLFWNVFAGNMEHPPKNGEIALLLNTTGLMCSKYVSQKRNEAIENSQWYNMLLNLISNLLLLQIRLKYT